MLKESESSEHHGAYRIAGLHRPSSSEGRLDWVEVPVGVQRFDGSDRVATCLNSQDNLRTSQSTVDQNGRSSSFTRGRAEADADHSLSAEQGKECFVGSAVNGAVRAVEFEGDLHQVTPPIALTALLVRTSASFLR